MVQCVLDASALMALFQGESGSERVAEAIKEGAAISAVNLAEVVSKLYEQGTPEAIIKDVIDILPLTIVDFTAMFAYKVGALRPLTKQIGLSLGDRACLALASHLNLPAITTDRIWGTLSLDVAVQVIR